MSTKKLKLIITILLWCLIIFGLFLIFAACMGHETTHFEGGLILFCITGSVLLVISWADVEHTERCKNRYNNIGNNSFNNKKHE